MELENNSSKSKRILWLDVARTIAIIAITLNHAVNRAYSGVVIEDFHGISLASFVLKAIVFVFSCLGVPLFIMISGTLLLKKDIKDEKDTVNFYKHNLLRLFITAEIWYAIFYIVTFFLKTDGQISLPIMKGEVIGFISNALFFNQRTFNSTWYLPMIICVYILVPFISIIKNKISFKVSLVALIPLFYLSIIIPTLNEVSIISGNVSIHFGMGNSLDYPILCSMYILYLISGYFLSKGIMKKLSNFLIVAGFVITFIVTCAFQFFCYIKNSEIHVWYQSIGVFSCSVFLFELIKRKGEIFLFAKKTFTYIARISFGIYFIHIAIMESILKYMEIHQIVMAEPIKLIFFEIVSFVGSIVIIAPLSKIPFFKKYVFMIK